MPFNGAGQFFRTFSWTADRAAGLDISSSRMDIDTNDITANGLSNCVTRDGQGSPSANLPMNNFRVTNLGNAVARSDAPTLGQVQDDLLNWTIAGGTSDAITATYTPALTFLNDGQICFLRATAANATTTPTFAPNGLTPEVITKLGGTPLGIADIAGALAEIVLRYNAANTRWELLNPSNASLNTGIPTTGHVAFTLASTAPTGWLMFNDGTIGSASSGSSYASAANLALFNILFAGPFTDATCPMLTSTGSATTRAAQGTAAAAWAANCRMSLPRTLGRALAVAGSGSGLTTRTLGQTLGEETHLLSTTEIPAHTHPNTLTDPGHTHTSNANTDNNSASTSGSAGALIPLPGAATINSNTTGITINNANNTGGGGTHNNMQPTSFLNAMVKQ
jgi:microcystin-dependent protein